VQGNPLFYTAWTRSGHDEGVYHALSSRVFFHLGIRVAAISLTIAIKKKITVNVSLFWPAKQAAADIVDTTNTSRSAAGDRGNEFGRLNTRRCVAWYSTHPLLGHTAASMQAQGDCDQGCPESADSAPASGFPSEARARWGRQPSVN
jgi:hypothetical protein